MASKVISGQPGLSRAVGPLLRTLQSPWYSVVSYGQWFQHLPHRFAEAFRQAVSAAKNAITTTLLLIFKVMLGLYCFAILFAIAPYLYKWAGILFVEWRQARRDQAEARDCERAYRETQARAAQAEEEMAAAERLRRLEAQADKARAERMREQIKLAKDELAKQHRASDARRFKTWRLDSDVFFAQSELDFPEPPAWPCNEPQCLRSRELRACKHSLRRLLGACGDLAKTVEVERNRWHPNSFKGARVHSLRDDAKGIKIKPKSLELSQVLQAILDELQEPAQVREP